MNLDTFRSRVQGATGVKTSAAGNERDLVDGWINDGITDFLRRTKLITKTAKLAVVAGTDDYTLDTDILAMKELWYEPSGNQSVLLEPVADLDITRWRRASAIVASANPWAYALDGANRLMLYPAPASSSDFLHVAYTPRPSSLLATGSDDPSTAGFGEIPKEWHYVIEAYAKWKAGEFIDRQDAQKWQQEYLTGTIEAIKGTTTKAGVRLGRVTWGSRRQIITRNDVDDGS